MSDSDPLIAARCTACGGVLERIDLIWRSIYGIVTYDESDPDRHEWRCLNCGRTFIDDGESLPTDEE
jgi:hypothetical protein